MTNHADDEPPYPVDTGRKLNVLCAFNLRPLSAGYVSWRNIGEVLDFQKNFPVLSPNGKLGVTIDAKLRFEKQIEQIYAKATKL